MNHKSWNPDRDVEPPAEFFRLLTEELSDEGDSGSECGEMEESGPQPLPEEEDIWMEGDEVTGELHPAYLRQSLSVDDLRCACLSVVSTSEPSGPIGHLFCVLCGLPAATSTG